MGFVLCHCCRQNSGVKDRYDSLTNSVKESSIIEPTVVPPATGRKVSIPDVFNSPSPPPTPPRSPPPKPQPPPRNGVVERPLPPSEKPAAAVRGSPAPVPGPRVRRKPSDGSPAPSPKTARKPRVRGLSGGEAESDGSPTPSPKVPRKPKFLCKNVDAQEVGVTDGGVAGTRPIGNGDHAARNGSTD